MSLLPGILASSAGSSSGRASFYKIATLTSSGSQSSFTFSSIPTTFKALQIRGIAKTANTSNNGDQGFAITVDGISTSSYTWHQLYGNGSSTGIVQNFSSSLISFDDGAPTSYTGTSSTFGVSIFNIIDYNSSSKYKTIQNIGGSTLNAGAGGYGIGLDSGMLAGLNTVSSITISSTDTYNFVSGTTFTLYGVN